MRIIELNITQFGKFKDRTFKLEDGFNIVKGENESGKSTLLGFIKFALYGVGRKNPNVAVGERERAISWNAGIAAGSLTLEDGDGRRYRIERSGREGARGAYVDKVRIIDLESGEEVFGGEVPGEHFLGINAQAYDSICNIKQLECTSVGADAVKGVIDNLLSSGDENTNIQAAIKALDTERRRLLHANGKGGLVYESELALERLRSEHRSAVIFENECIKNSDELDRVELALSKAQEEHRIAQRMCDLHDDVLRLRNFDRLKELKLERDRIAKMLNNLNANAKFDTQSASYENIAHIKSVSDSLKRSENAFRLANDEVKMAKFSLYSLEKFEDSNIGEIIEEFGSPDGAMSYLLAKRKKKKKGFFVTWIFGMIFLIAFEFAISMALYKNLFGFGTLAFIASILLAVAVWGRRQFTAAKADIAAFVAKVGCSETERGAWIRRRLEHFYNDIALRDERTKLLEQAKFRLSIAEEDMLADIAVAKELLSSFKAEYEEGREARDTSNLAEGMSEYLERKSEVDKEISRLDTLIKSLSSELERFSERDIRARITPEIIEKVGNTSFERLKAERDAALHKTNQFGQYKAGIERNIASSAQRRSSSEIFPQIEAEEERLGSLKLRLDAVRLAMEAIERASLELKSDITPRIRERAEKNLSIMTAGKYNELFIDENMSLSVFADGATRPIDSLSKGSLDVAYFAVRLALANILLGDKRPPLYMDEALSQLDDGRAENTLRAIADHASESQCILFTCQQRDLDLARSITDVNVIEL